MEIQKDLIYKLKETVNESRQVLMKKEECTHDENDLSTMFTNIINGNSENTDKTFEFVKKQTEEIEKNMTKICVAPGEGGKWKNWRSELFLEEKLFPALFPYGIGGYLSSNMWRQNDMGLSNYVKNRLVSADAKFRNDPAYLFFLLLVKEIGRASCRERV